jgi:hypothetical protein
MKNIGIYGVQESTANNKVEDLYLVMDEKSICFVVKNHINGAYIAFEYFENTSDQDSLNQLLGYLQNNSKLIQSFYRQVQFVMNTKRTVLTKSVNAGADTFYHNEFSLVIGTKVEEEVLLQKIGHNQVLVYGVPDALSTLLTRSFPTGKWMNYLSSLVTSNHSDGVCVTVFDDYFIVLVLQNGKPHFVNYFNRGGDTQNQYLVLNACVQAKIRPNETNLNVIGYSAERDFWMKELANYFAGAHMQHTPDEGIGASLNAEHPNHHYAPFFIF